MNDGTHYKKSNRWIYFLLLLTVLGWGLSWPLGSIIVNSLPPLFAAFLRYSIAMPLFILAAKVLDKESKFKIRLTDTKLQLKLAGLGALQVTLYNIFFLTGLKYTSSSDATLIIAINPTLTAIFAAGLYVDEKLTKNRILGLSTALIGVTLIVLRSPNVDVENRLLGDSIIFGAALIWASFTVLSRPLFKQITPLTFTAWTSVYGWIFLLISTLFVDIEYFSIEKLKSIPADVLWALMFLAVVAAVYGNIAFNTGIQRIGPSKTAIFVNFVPVFGVFFSVLLLSDDFSMWYFLSFFLILFGVLIINKEKRKLP